MDQKKILVIGSTGLVGSYFAEKCKDKFEILTAGLENCDFEINLLNKEQIDSVIKKVDATDVINFAAFTNVGEAEKEKNNLDGIVYKLNVLAPMYLAETCLESGKKLYHISTDYVFNGKQADRPYKETDIPNPLGWYAKTKYEGELKVQEILLNDFTIFRIALPFNGLYTQKLDIARAVIERLKNNQEYSGITDHKITPSNVLDIADGISLIIEKEKTGIYHLVSRYEKRFTSAFEFANKIAKKFNLEKTLIKPVTFSEYFKEKTAITPQNTWLDTTKIESLGMKFLTEEESQENFKNDYLTQTVSSFP